jgi:hypothetical protein
LNPAHKSGGAWVRIACERAGVDRSSLGNPERLESIRMLAIDKQKFKQCLFLSI